jgi:hypothetical protein
MVAAETNRVTCFTDSYTRLWANFFSMLVGPGRVLVGLPAVAFCPVKVCLALHITA